MRETALAGLAVLTDEPAGVEVEDDEADVVVEEVLDVDEFFDDEQPATANGTIRASGMNLFKVLMCLSLGFSMRVTLRTVGYGRSTQK